MCCAFQGYFRPSSIGYLLRGARRTGRSSEKQLMNERGKPKVYWLAYKPPGGSGEDASIYSRQTPFTTNSDGENKSGGGKDPYGQVVEDRTAEYEPCTGRDDCLCERCAPL